MRVMSSDLSSMQQDLQGTVSVLAPSVVAGAKSAIRKGVVRKREGRVVLGYG